jgi:hypothetical protein
MKRLPWKDGKAPLPPKQRPKCHYCGRPLRPIYGLEWARVERDSGFINTPVARIFSGRYGDSGFCGTKHGYLWAVVTVRDLEAGKLIVRRVK